MKMGIALLSIVLSAGLLTGCTLKPRKTMTNGVRSNTTVSFEDSATPLSSGKTTNSLARPTTGGTKLGDSAEGSRKQQIITNVVNRRTHPAPYPYGKRTATNDPKKAAAPPPLPKPSLKPGPVFPMPNGSWQISSLDHENYRVNELWLTNYKKVNGVWQEEFVFSGNSKSNPHQGVIGEFVINSSQFRSWTLSNPVGSDLKITSVSGNIVSYTSTQGACKFTIPS